jgi:phosphoglycolate phosphatase-like HAD superfamily hydrolase
MVSGPVVVIDSSLGVFGVPLFRACRADYNRHIMFVLLFDIDGTLLNTGGAGQRAMELALETAFGVEKPTEGISAAGRTDRAITRDLFEYHGIEDTAAVWETFQQTYLIHLAEELPRLEGRILPGVERLLSTLEERDDVVMGLLTGNFRQGAELKLRHYGLFDYFVTGGFGDHHPDRDDVARMARTAIEDHHQSPVADERLWVIGDTPHDVRCGRAIGARVAAVATGTFSIDELRETDPDHLFEDLSDHEPLLASLC